MCQRYLAQSANWGHLQDRIGIRMFLRRRKNRSTRRKPLGARKRTNNKLNPRMAPGPGVEPGPQPLLELSRKRCRLVPRRDPEEKQGIMEDRRRRSAGTSRFPLSFPFLPCALCEGRFSAPEALGYEAANIA